jgi:hypothetical protein
MKPGAASIRIVLLLAIITAVVFVPLRGAQSNKADASAASRQDTESAKNRDTASLLKGLRPDAVESMEIFRISRAKGKQQDVLLDALGENQISAISALCREATLYERPLGLEPEVPTRKMVIKLKNGDTVGIPYSLYLHEPFGPLEFRPLKEALYALSTRVSYCSVIHFCDGRILSVDNCEIPRIGRSRNSKRYTASMHLDHKGPLLLSLILREGRKTVLKSSEPMGYGQAKVFKHEGKGHMIVLLYMPTRYD